MADDETTRRPASGSFKPRMARPRRAPAPRDTTDMTRAVQEARAAQVANPQGADARFLTGQMLVAMPSMADTRFARAVIYVCAHTDEAAMGIVINRPLAKPTFDDLLQQLDITPHPPKRHLPVCSGGPVDDSRGFVLHSDDWSSDGTLPVADSLALTASLDILKAVASGAGPRVAVLALGYSGWGPGQLDSEIRHNAWLTVPYDERVLFDVDDGSKWRRALGKLNIDPLLLSGAAGRA